MSSYPGLEVHVTNEEKFSKNVTEPIQVLFLSAATVLELEIGRRLKAQFSNLEVKSVNSFDGLSLDDLRMTDFSHLQAIVNP